MKDNVVLGSVSHNKDSSDLFYTEAKKVINLLKKDFVFPDGSFFLEKYGDNVFEHHIYPDLGDFIVFFLYFNEVEFVDKQIDLFKKSLKNGLLVSEFKSFGVSGLVKSYDYTDLLLGLYDIYMNSKSENDKKYLIHTADLSIKIFGFENDIKSYYSPKFHLGLPLFDTRDGTFIEFFCELYDLTGNERYLKVALNIYKKIIGGDFYKKYNLLPTFDSPKIFKLLSKPIIDNSKFNSG
ncbi:MAG: hypothetical protein QG594_2300, partial [Bacteroidota bacterium]|nr:hypothetical protein [Bacteroidota bacterium]